MVVKKSGKDNVLYHKLMNFDRIKLIFKRIIMRIRNCIFDKSSHLVSDDFEENGRLYPEKDIQIQSTKVKTFIRQMNLKQN